MTLVLSSREAFVQNYDFALTNMATPDPATEASASDLNQAEIDDILNSPSKPPSNAGSPEIEEIQRQDDLPGGIMEDTSRPSTTLEIDTEGGVATMSDPAGLPSRLPPLSTRDNGDIEGYRHNLDISSNVSEVIPKFFL